MFFSTTQPFSKSCIHSEFQKSSITDIARFLIKMPPFDIHKSNFNHKALPVLHIWLAFVITICHILSLIISTRRDRVTDSTQKDNRDHAHIHNAQPGGLPINYFNILLINQVTSFSSTVAAPGTTTSFEVTGLSQDTYYSFRIQAVNDLGMGPESPGALLKTAFTLPSRIENFTTVPNSEVLIPGASPDAVPTVSLSVTWTIPLSGDSNPIVDYRIFTYRVGDDYNQGASFRTADNTYQLTLLSGGVDYTFFIQAINSKSIVGPLSGALEYRTVTVVPREITSLKVVPAAVSVSPLQIAGT
jgi:hypothetical protein